MKTTIQIIGAALVMAFFMWIGGLINQKTEVKPYKVIDTETVSIMEQSFKPGDILTSKENGELMLWDSTMSEELIVGVVTDSGKIDTR